MGLKDKTDEELVSIIQNSSNGLKEEAISIFYVRYNLCIYNFIRGFIKDEEDAKNIVNDAFIKLIRYIPIYKNKKKDNNGSSFKTWLYTIAKNLCLTRIRQKKNKKEIIISQYDHNESLKYSEEKDYFYDQTPQTLPKPDELTERSDIYNIVNKEMDNLPDIFKEALKLKYYDDLSCKQISEILNIPEGTAKTRIFRGKEKLKKNIEEKYLEEVINFYPQ